MKHTPLYLLLALLLLGGNACDDSGNNGNAPSQTVPAAVDIPTPDFNPDSAYAFIEKQLSFGPRVPNSSGHLACAAWLVEKFKSYGTTVEVQTAVVTAWDGTPLNIQNIIAEINPQATKRIMLSAHWDTRPVADMDPVAANENTPIPGANDGGSGVAVLLELARIMQDMPPSVGIDIFLWDAEDYGKSEVQDSYCLGTQYWCRNPHKPNYRPAYGINLDMVGAQNAYFTKEGFSMQYAPGVVSKVWSMARQLGYGDLFVTHRTDGVIDDHLYVNRLANIPMIDIIDRPQGQNFFPEWHTLEDDLDVISTRTLEAVGETLLGVVYRE